MLYVLLDGLPLLLSSLELWKAYILLLNFPTASPLIFSKVFFLSFFLSFFLFFFVFLGPNPWHTEVPRLGVQSELQLPAYITATAMPEPSCICDLHHSSRQHWILNPLSEARHRTYVLMDASQLLCC